MRLLCVLVHHALPMQLLRTLLNFFQAVEVMKMAGFTEENEPEPALALRREDPGLIWLTLSAVKDSMVH
jgi:hypothetical protein